MKFRCNPLSCPQDKTIMEQVHLSLIPETDCRKQAWEILYEDVYKHIKGNRS